MAGGNAAALPWYKAIPQAALDMDRIAAHGITFGLNDRVVDALAGDNRATASYQAARDRAGIAGDVASVAGLGGGLKAGIGVVKALPTIAKAALTARGLTAAGLGLGSLAEYNARTEGDTPAPAAKAPAAPKGPDINAMAAKIAAAAQGAAPKAAAPTNTFQDMITRLAAGQGGMVSLRQLSALGEAADKGSQADYYRGGGSAKPPAPGDAAGHILEQQYINQYQKALSDPKADPTAAQKQFEDKVLQLRKTQFIDPYGLQQGAE